MGVDVIINSAIGGWRSGMILYVQNKNTKVNFEALNESKSSILQFQEQDIYSNIACINVIKLIPIFRNIYFLHNVATS